jgi:hypothetical protein
MNEERAKGTSANGRRGGREIGFFEFGTVC